MKPEAIFFDLGNVMVKLRTDTLIKGMLAASDPRWDPEALLLAIRELDGPHVDYEKGRIDGKAFHAHLQERFGLTLDYSAWLRLWNGYFEPNRPMEALLARLSGQARFFALSNTNPEHLSHLKMNFRFFDHFEDVLASHQVGARKPEPAMFAAALKRAGLSPDKALYIDDVKPFIDAAQSQGLQGFHYTYNDAELRQRLLALGFELPHLEGRSSAMFC